MDLLSFAEGRVDLVLITAMVTAIEVCKRVLELKKINFKPWVWLIIVYVMGLCATFLDSEWFGIKDFIISGVINAGVASIAYQTAKQVSKKRKAKRAWRLMVSRSFQTQQERERGAAK